MMNEGWMTNATSFTINGAISEEQYWGSELDLESKIKIVKEVAVSYYKN